MPNKFQISTIGLVVEISLYELCGAATINSNVNDYVVTATGTAGVLHGEPNMRFDSTNFYLSSYSGGSVTTGTSP